MINWIEKTYEILKAKFNETPGAKMCHYITQVLRPHNGDMITVNVFVMATMYPGYTSEIEYNVFDEDSDTRLDFLESFIETEITVEVNNSYEAEANLLGRI
jgi:hypothetical protein